MTTRKYVPPALRNKLSEEAASPASEQSYKSENGNGNGHAAYQSRPQYSRPQSNGGYNNNNSNNGGGSYEKRQFPSAFSKSNSRVSSDWGAESGGYMGGSRYSRKEETEEELFGNQNNTGINFDKYDEIPVEVKGKNCPPAVEDFNAVEIDPSLRKNIQRAKFEKPTPVQKYSLPIVMEGRDLMACAQTGSGKTAAFLFPLICRLLKEGLKKKELNNPLYGKAMATPQVLILAPTRELSTQIYDEARKFTFETGLRSVVVYGGADPKTQIQSLSKGCNILVATPGRLVDLMGRGYVTLSDIKYLVLDEADRMLDMGFEPQIREIIEGEKMPPTGARQTLMFSATFPKEIQQLAREFLNEYLFLTFGKLGQAAELVNQKVEFVEEDDKLSYLLKILNEREERTLVFVKTKKRADYIERFLVESNVHAISIHGDKGQKEREFAIKLFKKGQKNVLVATDVAARGLDIDNVTLVVNFDLPENIEDYVHRIGRTGRAGNEGYAVAFFNDDNKGIVNDLIKVLQDNKQTIAPFLKESSRDFYDEKRKKRGGFSGGFSRGSYGYRGGSNGFGSGGFGGGRGRGGGYQRSNNYADRYGASFSNGDEDD